MLVGENFDITGFSGNTSSPAGAGTTTNNNSSPAAVLWYVGSIAPGSSASATLTVKARTLGTTTVALIALSTAADPGCLDFNCEPATVSIQAIPVVLTAAAQPSALL